MLGWASSLLHRGTEGIREAFNSPPLATVRSAHHALLHTAKGRVGSPKGTGTVTGGSKSALFESAQYARLAPLPTVPLHSETRVIVVVPPQHPSAPCQFSRDLDHRHRCGTPPPCIVPNMDKVLYFAVQHMHTRFLERFEELQAIVPLNMLCSLRP